jgi:3-oxoacyl-[acyl-carrier protein] reductase
MNNTTYALVCGSTQGIGKATAQLLASKGHHVLLLARNEEKLKEVLASLPGAHHAYIVVDLSDRNALEQACDKLKELSISILINNTGGPAAGPAHIASTEAYLNAFNQHLIANQLLLQEVLPGMQEKKFGRVINIISTSVKQPLKGLGVSNTIRGAVANWSKTLATELAPWGITVNNVLPGATKTERLQAIISGKAEKNGTSFQAIEQEMLEEIPAGRFAEPGEIAHAIAFLASTEAGYINGINLPVDGGRTLSL